MLLKGFRTEIFLPACNSHFQSLHCIAYLDQDVSEVLPYLNAVLGGDTFIKEPPSLTFKMIGKLLTIHGRKIAVNALRDEAEAHSLLEWIKNQINEAWEKRNSIMPKYEGAGKAHPLTIYKLLPRSNCRQCGQPTCMAFAALAATGALGADRCTALDGPGRQKLEDYLRSFRFD